MLHFCHPGWLGHAGVQPLLALDPGVAYANRDDSKKNYLYELIHEEKTKPPARLPAKATQQNDGRRMGIAVRWLRPVLPDSGGR
jgi:hypothetical protein